MRRNRKWLFLEIDLGYFVVNYYRAKPFSLLPHVHHQFRPKDATWESRVVLYLAGRH
jgi:hypothetical protein